MIFLPVISSEYLRPAYKLVEDTSIYLGYLHKASLPARLPGCPTIIPLFSAFEVYKSIVSHIGLECCIKRLVAISNETDVFADFKQLLPISPPNPPVEILSQWISLIRQSNCETAVTDLGEEEDWFILHTCRHYKDSFLQDMIEIAWLQLAIRSLIPNFLPKRFRIRANSNKERRLWTKTHVSVPVEFSQPFIAVEIIKKDLSFPYPILPNVGTHGKPESCLMSLGSTPVGFPDTLAAILTSYHPDRWLTIEELAEITNSSARTIQRYLLESGTSFRKIVIEAKIKIAKKALTESDALISQIALDLGFSAPSSFTRCFVNHTGISPIEYRKLAQYSNNIESLVIPSFGSA
jgi:AraC-like DNA-binding protein